MSEPARAFTGRATRIDYDALAQLHFLGNYERELPVSLARMIENAYDWEHLPFVHPSSFAAIRLVEEGEWGWRCMVDLPSGGGEQAIELLVDKERHYWATSVVSGLGEGLQIHTKARSCTGGGIAIDVRFFAGSEPPSAEFAAMAATALRGQYARLYDEDEALMLGRQEGLDEVRKTRAGGAGSGPATASLGPVTSLDPAIAHRVELSGEAFCVRRSGSDWIAHSARCPHMLAPLGEALIEEGVMTCPWHGYRFDLASGAESAGRCGALKLADCDVNAAGELVVTSRR